LNLSRLVELRRTKRRGKSEFASFFMWMFCYLANAALSTSK
jgi:hypothetical protein